MGQRDVALSECRPPAIHLVMPECVQDLAEFFDFIVGVAVRVVSCEAVKFLVVVIKIFGPGQFFLAHGMTSAAQLSVVVFVGHSGGMVIGMLSLGCRVFMM